ncbi:MAG: type II toxin-antitoxin system RelE/ParE family toxin [Verrucomicrobiota bacterium]
MATYKVEFRKSVEKELRSISKKDQIRILQRISELAEEPRPSGCKKLSGQERYRLRQGNYRILYEIEDDRLIVTVVKVGDRRDVYRK